VFQLLADGIPVLLGHHDIQHDGIRRVGPHLDQALFAVVGQLDLKALPFEVALHQGGKISLIVDDQNSLLSSHGLPPVYA
jgi:hypothetical protein